MRGAILVAILALGWGQPSPAAAAPDAARSLQQVTLTVKNMSCAMCKYTVENALKQVEGVQSAKVDMAPGTAEVIFDPAKVSPQQLARAVSDAGYPAVVKR
ncbi:periplasmic mercuric ion binding protein [Methylomarinovum caldicuralii]|uniref:Periplasmic mercuric ion binding protein n=1 Tax=Methylomarinovum caldicuralii TaxID=438856 RepID=A0AAU9C9F5_9GAMM|nr:heavy-metal-associated domain-containing protein [Methylomarinovum caldicuralii]BCX82176.1 periplasmic mercuric ion binding protein [Methylomarinovum caldicuralii]